LAFWLVAEHEELKQAIVFWILSSLSEVADERSKKKESVTMDG
jgi:hypothetical protein